MATQVGIVSPTSGAESPGSPGGEKIGRAQAKKIFKDEVDRLVQAVKLIPVYADAFAELKRTAKLPVQFMGPVDPINNPQGPQRQYQYQIGRSEFKEFVSQTVKQMQRLPTLAFTLNKTRRRTAPNSGFLAPARFVQDIVNFFGAAEVGPIVTGGNEAFVIKTDKAGNRKMIPNSKTLQVQNGTRLNQLLYFTQQQLTNGQANPLYGIISPGTLTPLFALHAYYSQMQYNFDATRLSASAQMRQGLAQVMRNTIEDDARKIIAKYPGNAQVQQLVAQVQERLINTINNPPQLPPHPTVTARSTNQQVNQVDVEAWERNPQVAGSLFIGRIQINDNTYEEIFNPNYFLYAHFSKLISNGKASGDQALNDAQLNQVRQAIPQAYANVPGIAPDVFNQINAAWQQAQVQTPGQSQSFPAFENAVLHAQQNFVALARAYKNQIQGAEQRRRRSQEKAAQRQAQAQQVQTQAQQQALQGVSSFGTGAFGGLPQVQGLGNLPQTVQGLPGNLPMVGQPNVRL